MDERPIGVFDSGLGGLTTVKELERLLPNEEIIYFGDTGRVPYGTKGRETIKKYALQDVRFLNKFNVKIIVIACNTVTSVALDDVRAALNIPVIGTVEPASVAAVRETSEGRIGVIGTNATIGSGAFEKSIAEALPDAQIKSRACPLFVPLVENGYFMRGSKIAQLAAHEYLDEFKDAVDTLILGCTHYPLLRGVIEDVMPGVKLIDSGREAARVAADMLSENGLLSSKEGNSRFYVSDSAEDFARLAGFFLEHPVDGRVEKIEIERY